jgi:hypothetical protein
METIGTAPDQPVMAEAIKTHNRSASRFVALAGESSNDAIRTCCFATAVVSWFLQQGSADRDHGRVRLRAVAARVRLADARGASRPA